MPTAAERVAGGADCLSIPHHNPERPGMEARGAATGASAASEAAERSGMPEPPFAQSSAPKSKPSRKQSRFSLNYGHDNNT